MQTAAPDITQLKSRMKETWMAGDFGQIANFTAPEAENFVGRLGIRPGWKVLDVACGTGNTAIPAAKAGASVTGVDIAPNSLEQAKKWAESEQLNVRFEEGDAEDLRYEDHSFDVVLTMFGAMFAPRPEKVAAELLRVCKPGGIIAMANWTAQGFIGQMFKIFARFIAPPGMPSPVLWGDEETVRERLGSDCSNLRLTRVLYRFDYPFSPAEVVEFFRANYGPTTRAFAALAEPDRKTLREDLVRHWAAHNRSTDPNRTIVDAEYLEVVGTTRVLYDLEI